MRRAEVLESQESEFNCLGAVMLDNSAFDRLADIFGAEDLAGPGHALIWSAMARLISRREPVDPTTLATMLEQDGTLGQVGHGELGGVLYLLGLAEAVATSVNIEHHGRIVAAFAAKRRMLAKLEDAGRRLRETPTDELEQFRDALVADLLTSAREPESAAVDIVKAAREVYEELRAREANPNPIVGIPTGLAALDDITSGWEDGDLITLGACSGHGKTLAGVQFAAEGARLSRRHSLYISVEVRASRIARRLMAAYAQVDASALKTATLDAEGWAKLGEGVQRFAALRGLMSVVYAPKATVGLIHREVRRHLLREHAYPLGLVVVDYVQRLHADEKRRSREEEVADIARSLKDLANVYNVPVIALAQLNRDLFKRANKRPVVSDLRESSALEHESSHVVFLHRPELWGDESMKGKAELIVAKARDGEAGIATVGCNPAQQRLYDLDWRHG